MSSVRRRRLGAGVVLIAFVGVAVAAWLIGTRVQSPSQAAAQAAPPDPSWVTAPVELRVLSSTVITRGNVKPALTTSVTGPAASAGAADDSSGVVTGLFVAPGDEVVAGDRVVEVAGRPVFVFEGVTPAFRALRPGMTGEDVAQLQAGLAAGGCDTGDRGAYDEATTACVEQLYADAGYATVRGSTSEVADLAAAEAALESAQDSLETAENALTVASQPPAAADLSAAQSAVDDAQRAYDAAVRSQPASIATATETLDSALAALNALLAGSDPNAAAGAAATGGDATTADPATGDGAPPASTSGSGVAARTNAWAAVGEAARGVDEAALDGVDEVAAAASALQTANDALAGLAAPDTSAEQLAVDQQREAVERAEADLAELEAVSGAVVPFGEVVFVPELPARVDSVEASVGSGTGGEQRLDATGDGAGSATGGALVVLASPSLQADISIPQTARALVQAGIEVELLDEASGETVAGTVASVADRLQPSATSGLPSYLAVVEAELPEAWSGRNVRATFTAASTDHEVLVVPSAAVSSAADGQSRVQVERVDGTVETVDVTTGLSADGYVEVTGEGDVALVEGDRVVIGR